VEEGGRAMAIMVHFKDDTVSFVPDKDLGELILTDRIVAFRRGTSWVGIGGSALQGQTAPGYNAGKERRRPTANGDVWKRIMITDAR
jgi:hypothetical protein